MCLSAALIDGGIMPFKVTKSDTATARALVEAGIGSSKRIPEYVAHDGIEGTGVTLPYICGFCRDENGAPTAAFRSRKERNAHTNKCPN